MFAPSVQTPYSGISCRGRACQKSAAVNECNVVPIFGQMTAERVFVSIKHNTLTCVRGRGLAVLLSNCSLIRLRGTLRFHVPGSG